MQPTVELRPMQLDDLALVEQWLGEPHVARWFLAGSSLGQELDDIRLSVTGGQPVHVFVVVLDEEPIGWCQWYLCDEDPEWAAEIGAQPGDIGVDYALGHPGCVGHGVGTRLVEALVGRVRAAHPGCGVVADPDAHNSASRRVLEKNGFELVMVKSLESEPTDDLMAIYRLAGGRDLSSAG